MKLSLKTLFFVTTLDVLGACTAEVPPDDAAQDDSAITDKELEDCKPFPGATRPEPSGAALKERCAQIAKGNTPPFDDKKPVCLGHNNDKQPDIKTNCLDRDVDCQVLSAGKNYSQDWNRDLLDCIEAGLIGNGRVILCSDKEQVNPNSATGSEWCWMHRHGVRGRSLTRDPKHTPIDLAKK